MFRLGEVLDWLPNRSTAQKRHSNKMYFKFESEVPPVELIRLKIEINCFEHFNVMGLNHVPFKMRNPWFSGETEIATYHLEELIGTKMRALYQRKKGRDLFDISCALTQGDLNIEKVLECYRRYMEFVVERAPSYKEFVLNMNGKMNDSEFLTDVAPLLRPEIHFDPTEAYRSVYDNLIDRLPGKRD